MLPISTISHLMETFELWCPLPSLGTNMTIKCPEAGGSLTGMCFNCSKLVFVNFHVVGGETVFLYQKQNNYVR